MADSPLFLLKEGQIFMREASVPWQSGSGDPLLFKFKAFVETFLSKRGMASVCEVLSVRNTLVSQKGENKSYVSAFI
jgi:hypothetical protein